MTPRAWRWWKLTGLNDSPRRPPSCAAVLTSGNKYFPGAGATSGTAPAECLAGPSTETGLLDNYEFLLATREEFANEPIIPLPLVRGDDLKALGMKPAPQFGGILEAVERVSWKGRFGIGKKRSRG